MRKVNHKVDICVIGGGMAGLCAAVSAARHDAKVALLQDRPVLGGNASSEIRMHICGADRNGELPNLRETGILEEIRLTNAYRNPQGSYSMWDTLLWELVQQSEGLTVLLNCSCLKATVNESRIVSVTGWQLTTETWHEVEANLFIDCSGDGISASLTGADYRIGRESRYEFGESLAPKEPDTQTMGCTCLFKASKHDTPQKFVPPDWAYVFPTDEDIGLDRDHSFIEMGYWWIELGGSDHPIYDLEDLRDELLKIVFGIWDHIKNYGDHGAEYYALDWIEFLPGKRESRRLIGDLILTQKHIEAQGKFMDTVAYGGWTMDDHVMGGFRVKSMPPTVWNPCPSPYGISYRCLYSKNIKNLAFAGRNISATHIALSSTRVMGTCSVLGQAIGTAAALCIKKGCDFRQLGEQHISTLQQQLMTDDCYLPGFRRSINPLALQAALSGPGNPEPLRDGIDRSVGSNSHCWEGEVGDAVTYSFSEPRTISRARLVFDSGLDRALRFTFLEGYTPSPLPDSLVSEFRIQANIDGKWRTVKRVTNNHQRLVYVDLNVTTCAVRFIPEKTRGTKTVRLFAFTVL